MQKEITLKLKPSEAADDSVILTYLAQSLAQPVESILGFYRAKQSIDARNSKQVWINITLQAL